jgi:hypothetical protein
MAGDHELLSSAVQGTTLTVMARIGFGARGLVYLLVAAFATAAALGFRQRPHGMVDAVQAVSDHARAGMWAAAFIFEPRAALRRTQQ